MGDGSIAEDLAAEVFSKAWEGIDRFEWRDLPFEHWLLRIARNVVIDHWRSNRRSHSSIEDLHGAASADTPPDERVAYEFDVARLRSALARLPDDQRDVLILRFIEGYSHADTAAVVKKSVVAVRQIQVRALKALEKIMNRQAGVEAVSRDSRGLRAAPRRERGPTEEPAH